MTKTVLTRPDLSELENVRLHNMAMMYLNIQEDDSQARATAYLAAELKKFEYSDVEPFIKAAAYERGLVDELE